MIKPMEYRELTIEQAQQVHKTLSEKDDPHNFAYFVGTDGKVQAMIPKRMLPKLLPHLGFLNKVEKH